VCRSPTPQQSAAWWDQRVGAAAEQVNRAMLRARDHMDRHHAEPLDVAAVARVAHVSPAHFARTFRRVFGESPHRYLQRRRVERAMVLLRTTDLRVTDVCLAVGFTSLGTFSRTFSAVVGESPTAHRARGPLGPVPSCFAKAWLRPVEVSRNGEATGPAGDLPSAAC
jgi:AraC-like DNA-binding protein